MKLVAAKCPNCGAQIDVDKNSDSTKCEYCDSKILIEDAIEKYKLEISGAIEINNMPKLENYIKLGNRNYEDGEFNEAYKMYSKAIELDPDNYIIVLRQGLSKTLCTNYEDFEISPAINAMKHVYKILKKENNILKLNESISECNNVIKSLDEILVKEYKRRKLEQNEVIPFNMKIESCLVSFEYLYSIIDDDKELKKKVINNLIQEIKNLLLDKYYIVSSVTKNGYAVQRLYKLSKSKKNSLLAKKQWYMTELAKLNTNTENGNIGVTTQKTTVGNDTTKSKNSNEYFKNISKIDFNKYFSGTSIGQRILDIMSYLLLPLWGIMFLGNLLTGAFLSAFLWGLVILLFLPPIKKIIVEKTVNKCKRISAIIVVLKIILVIFAFATMMSYSSNIDYDFEKIWLSENNIIVELKDENAVIKLSDGTELKGKYSHKGTSENYTITVELEENNLGVKEYIFKYEKNGDEVKFYLEEDGKNIYFVPQNKENSYIYLKE